MGRRRPRRRRTAADLPLRLAHEIHERLERIHAELLKRRPRPVGPDRLASRKPATVVATNDESDFYTIVDVTANDRLGLLHDLTRTLADHGCEIYISKAATVLDQVTDTFYLKDAHGKKLSDPEQIERLRLALLAAAERGEAGLGGS